MKKIKTYHINAGAMLVGILGLYFMQPPSWIAGAFGAIAVVGGWELYKLARGNR